MSYFPSKVNNKDTWLEVVALCDFLEVSNDTFCPCERFSTLSIKKRIWNFRVVRAWILIRYKRSNETLNPSSLIWLHNEHYVSIIRPHYHLPRVLTLEWTSSIALHRKCDTSIQRNTDNCFLAESKKIKSRSFVDSL